MLKSLMYTLAIILLFLFYATSMAYAYFFVGFIFPRFIICKVFINCNCVMIDFCFMCIKFLLLLAARYCPPLTDVKNGTFLDPACKTNHYGIGAACVVGCNAGFRSTFPPSKYYCNGEKEWFPFMNSIRCIRKFRFIYL